MVIGRDAVLANDRVHSARIEKLGDVNALMGSASLVCAAGEDDHAGACLLGVKQIKIKCVGRICLGIKIGDGLIPELHGDRSFLL